MNWSAINHNDKLPSIMTRLASIGVTKISTTDYLYNDKAIIHWSNKDINNILPSIMTRLPSVGVTKISTIDYVP